MPQAKHFYARLYLFWLTWVSIRAFLLSGVLAFLSTIYIYFSKGSVPLNQDSFLALKQIFLFSFPIAFSFSFILMLLLVFKAVFYKKIAGLTLSLYDCEDKKIQKPLLSDVSKLWRKWLFLSVWAVLFLILLLLGLDTLFFEGTHSKFIFNGISLYFYVLILGGGVFTFGMKRCTKVRVKDA
ncbi:hypothetical protein JHD50_02105 [Sulfurimonas sp. MAG313]|nr:hypothetical protein [Sulfurimonas sp. MAG313]MDF1880104.1 hypothetical protein [Sulfurimonas sp. MAG313]